MRLRGRNPQDRAKAPNLTLVKLPVLGVGNFINLERGLVLCVYPDTATLLTMREEDWSTVTVGFKKNEAGGTTELLFRKEGPIKIRYEYGHQRPHVRFTMKGKARAVAKPDAGACQVTRRGQDFVFDITNQLTITSAGATSSK